MARAGVWYTDHISDDHDMQDVSVAKGDAAVSDEDDIDWDGTVLSEAFTMKQPKHTYM